MIYRAYKVRVQEPNAITSGWPMQVFLHHINIRKEKIMCVIPVGEQGLFVQIITLGQDED